MSTGSIDPEKKELSFHIPLPDRINKPPIVALAEKYLDFSNFKTELAGDIGDGYVDVKILPKTNPNFGRKFAKGLSFVLFPIPLIALVVKASYRFYIKFYVAPEKHIEMHTLPSHHGQTIQSPTVVLDEDDDYDTTSTSSTSAPAVDPKILAEINKLNRTIDELAISLPEDANELIPEFLFPPAFITTHQPDEPSVEEEGLPEAHPAPESSEDDLSELPEPSRAMGFLAFKEDTPEPETLNASSSSQEPLSDYELILNSIKKESNTKGKDFIRILSTYLETKNCGLTHKLDGKTLTISMRKKLSGSVAIINVEVGPKIIAKIKDKGNKTKKITITSGVSAKIGFFPSSPGLEIIVDDDKTIINITAIGIKITNTFWNDEEIKDYLNNNLSLLS